MHINAFSKREIVYRSSSSNSGTIPKKKEAGKKTGKKKWRDRANEVELVSTGDGWVWRYTFRAPSIRSSSRVLIMYEV